MLAVIGRIWYFYSPPIKLWEDNVFSCVCLSLFTGGSHVTIALDALDLSIQGPPWTCSKLFKLVITVRKPLYPRHVRTCSTWSWTSLYRVQGPPPPVQGHPDMFELVHDEAGSRHPIKMLSCPLFNDPSIDITQSSANSPWLELR